MTYIKELREVRELNQEDIKKLKEENDEVWEQSSKVTGEKLKLHSEIEKLKKWSLSKDMIERTSAETIEEFEKDVRDNWNYIEKLEEEISDIQGDCVNKSDIYDWVESDGSVILDKDD